MRLRGKREKGLGLACLGLMLLMVGCGAPHQDRALPAPSGRIYHIGYLGTSPGDPTYEGLRQGLRDLGYVEGQTIAMELRFSSIVNKNPPELAAELVQLPLDVIVVAGGAGATAAAQATRTIPIVFQSSPDPVAAGLVASLPHPGGNVTGVMSTPPELVGKQLQLLKEVAPQSSVVAVLLQAGDVAGPARIRVLNAAAQTLSVQLVLREIDAGADLDAAFAAFKQAGADSLVVVPGAFANVLTPRIAELALRDRIPGIFGRPDSGAAGALMAYGVDTDAGFRRSAVFVDKILKGAKPADLPVEGPTQFNFVINLRTARALGITVPEHVLIQATEVIP